MELDEYQKRAMTTCLPESNNFSYMMLNLVGEMGEFASKVAKSIRKGKAGIGIYNFDNDLIYTHDCEIGEANKMEEELQKEAGDILWQLAGLCSAMDWDLNYIAMQNLEKLASRKERGVIDGNGDNR